MPGLQDLYREIVLDHYHHPRNSGELPSPPARRAEGFNPLCGDEVRVSVLIEGESVQDVRVVTQGCSISTSSASMMSTAVKGHSLEEVAEVVRTFKAMMSIHEAAPEEDEDDLAAASGAAGLGDLAALQGVVQFPVRIKCATLPWNTLVQAIEQRSDQPATSE